MYETFFWNQILMPLNDFGFFLFEYLNICFGFALESILE